MQKSVATEHPRSIQPWESSEEVFTSAASQLGLPETLFFKEIWDLEDFLPSGTIALILVYPTPTDYEERKTRGSISPGNSDYETGQQNLDVTYLSQRVQNACGPYALFHAVFNSHARQRIIANTLLDTLRQRLSQASSHATRSTIVETDSELWTKCSELGKLGHTPLLEDVQEEVEPHFVSFAGLHGNLGLFDGDRMPGPKDLGIKLGVNGLISNQALNAVQRHLDTHAGDNRDFSTLLALVDTAIE